MHVECAWRIAQEERVLAGSVDVYYPADLRIEEPLPGDAWDKGPNRLEVLMRALFEEGKREFIVRRVDVGAAGALSIVMDGGLSLDVLPQNSLSDEYWRLFRPHTDDKHFVVTGRGIEEP